MVNEGQTAPDFDLYDEKEQKVSLQGLKGKNIVLYFYPKDDTPGCTIEANEFNGLLNEFKKSNTVVLGVSADDSKSHQKFCDKYSLKFTLLADTDKEVVNKYGVWKEKSMYGKKYMGIERTTFLIDDEGVVRKIYPKVKVKGHAEAVLHDIRELAAA